MMRSVLKLAIFVPVLLSAQEAPKPAEIPAGTVVASAGGRKITAGELESFVKALPGQVEQGFNANRKEFVRQYVLMDALSRMAEKDGLDKESPAKERLLWGRMQLLAQAQYEKVLGQIPVPEDALKQYYEKNKVLYTEAKVKVIYISFSANPAASPDPKAKKPLTETEAKAKAERLLKELRAGADFAKLAKQNSEDPTSAEKGGDFGTVKYSASLPAEIKKVIFSLKPKELSEVLQQPNGFYIFGTDEVTVQPYASVRDKIIDAVKTAEFDKWMKATTKDLDLKFENEAFYSMPSKTRPPAPAK
jgi:hypothetical protein